MKSIKDIQFWDPLYRRQPLIRFGCFLTSLFNENYWLASFSVEHSFRYWRYLNGEMAKEKEEWQKFMKSFIQRFEKDLPLLDDIFQNCYYIGNKILDESRILKELDFTRISSRHLLFRFHAFMEQWNYIICFIMGTYPMEDFLTEKTKQEFTKHLEKQAPEQLGKADELLKVLHQPVKKNFMNEEKDKLLEILVKLQEKGILSGLPHVKRDVNRKLDKHFEKYCWLSTRFFWGKPWNKEDFKIRIQKLLKEDCRKLLSENNQKEQFMHALKIKTNPVLLRLIKLSQELIYFRTYRTDVVHLSAFNLRPLLNELAARFGYSYKEIINMTVSEIVNLPNKRISHKILQERINGYAVLVVNQKPRIYQGKGLEKLKNVFKDNGIDKDITEIKGNIAFKGKAKGRVRIFYNSNGVSEFKEGEILVTNMTTPNLMPAMKKASAFVTDEGGITCHAAIIAREMKKPCVIGTQIATKVFKDGDLVEVDADNGVVRKL